MGMYRAVEPRDCVINLSQTNVQRTDAVDLTRCQANTYQSNEIPIERSERLSITVTFRQMTIVISTMKRVSDSE